MRTFASTLAFTTLLFVPALSFAQGSVTFGGGAGGSAGTTGGATGGAKAAPATAPAAPAAAAAGGASGAAAASTAELPDGPVREEGSSEKEWEERDRLLGESQVLSGGVGFLHTQHAQAGAPGQFRMQFMTEYFSAGFLCDNDYPCKNPRGLGQITSDSLDHIGGTLSLSASILSWLEAYASTGAYANSDAANRPSLLQVLGDTDFGAKAYGPLSKIFHVGGAMELWLVNGTGAVGLDGSGTTAKFRALGTADLRGSESKMPLRFSLNTTYVLDNTGDVLAATETARNAPVTRIERFGLSVNRVDHFDIHVGGEFFVADEKVRPFLEYSVAIPVNRQGYLCKPTNPSADHCLATDPVAPSKLTLGGRFLPWKHGFGLTAALDIGLTGTHTFIEEVAPTPPWMLFIGAGWAIDTQDRPPVERIKTVEKVVNVVSKQAKIKGFVHEKDKEQGIANVLVAWENHPELTALATGADGRFTTQELSPGAYTFLLSAIGYKEGATCSATITGDPKGGPNQVAPKDVAVDCLMEALPKVGALVGHVKDADTQVAVPIASVKLIDAASKELRVQVDASGGFRIEQLPPGVAQMTIEAEGYMSAVQPADVKVRQDNTADVLLRKRPKNASVTVGAKEITIKQQIQFALDSAVILPESFGLMTEIADAMVRNPRIRRIEIQGHTDSDGSPEHNRILSDDRANAVKTWLTSHGVAGDRLTAKGYGPTKPIAPNVTAGNKAKNRRVQFIISDQDAATPAPAATPPAAAKKGPPAPPIQMPF